MSLHPFHLEASWEAVEGTTGRFRFTLFNLGAEPVSGFRLAYTSLTRTADVHVCEGATLLRRVANFHEYAPPAGLSLQPGECWIFTVSGLTRQAKHCTDGVKSAYLTTEDGRALPVGFGDLMLKGGHATMDVTAGDFVPVALYPAPGSSGRDIKAVATVLALYKRLFPVANVPFSLVQVDGGLPVQFATSSCAAEGYALTFSAESVTLSANGDAGVQYGLTTLAQLLHGARTDPDIFAFPVTGGIEDGPRFSWRGCHLDVSRQFYPEADIVRLLDILAWNKLNVFHWHLTDDEAWRIEIKAFPELTEIGARRGPHEVLVPQLGDGAETRTGHYSQDTVRSIVAHAGALHVQVVPEIDIPGHCTAALFSLPHLQDGQEAPDSYRSVQGYPNNALNPAIAATYDFLGAVFDELVDLFPSDYIHIGGDEVADGSWLASPLCIQLMKVEGIEGTFGLQSYFLKKIKSMLTERDKKLSGWNEVSHGGGVEAEGTLLMAWQNSEIGIELAQAGYDVVMTPGQAYYLDMAQADNWLEPGASWAGTTPQKLTYDYEAGADFPDALLPRLKGIQACIWSENFVSKAYFNKLVFPRLNAIAEAAWVTPDAKNWKRFTSIVTMLPKL